MTPKLHHVLVITLALASSVLAQTAPSPLETLFKRLDRNGDGKLTGDEASPARREAFDLNKDGVVTLDETPRGRTAETSTANNSASAIATQMDVRYAEVPPGVDANHLSLDVYAPKDAKNLPVMVYIHGGSWQAGDKRAVGAKPGYFTSRGFVFVSLNYRLVPAVDLLTQLQDSANAIGWVKQNIAKHGGDPARLHLIGHSAGAHHVAILATNERFLKTAGVALGDLKSVVELDTQALDVPTMMGDGESTTYGPAFGRDRTLWPQVSPLHHVAKDKGIPPFFLVVANSREQKLAQAAAFQKALQAAGVRCEFIEAPQHDHGSLNRAIGDKADKVTQAMEQFHDSILGGKQKSAAAANGNLKGLPDGNAMYEWVKTYAAFGEHRAASEADRKTADWLAETLREGGAERVVSRIHGAAVPA